MVRSVRLSILTEKYLRRIHASICSILGAILLTGYMGGATATQVRLEDPWVLFPVVIGGLAWLGIFLRDERLRTLIPLRKS